MALWNFKIEKFRPLFTINFNVKKISIFSPVTITNKFLGTKLMNSKRLLGLSKWAYGGQRRGHRKTEINYSTSLVLKCCP